MSLQVTSWNDVPQADYDSAYSLLVQLVAEGHPELDTRRGVLNDIVLQLLGVLAASLRIEEANLLASNSLLAISQNPSLADPDTVSGLFSNYFLTSQSGAIATGLVTVVLTQPTPVVVPSGFVFTASGISFATTSSIAARLQESDILSASDVLLLQQNDGTATFTFSVTAQALGTAGNIVQKTALAPSAPIANFKSAYAAQDFTGGQNADTIASLLARLQGGISAKTWSNPINLQSLVNSSTLFPSAFVSIVGAGRAEMLRDKHSVLPIAYGNRVDVWVRQPAQTASATVTKAATYIKTGDTGPIWMLPITRNDIPGLYAVTGLLRTGRPDSATVIPYSTIRSYIPAIGDPDIVSALEAAFSRYQSAVLTFTDPFNTGESLTAGATASYAVTAVCTQYLDQLQAFLDSSASRPIAGDVVVRGAVPFFIYAEVQLDSLPASVPVNSIATAISGAINGTGFIGTLYTSMLAALVLPLLPAGVNLQRIKLTGILFRPDGTNILYRSQDSLAIPNLPAVMVTSSTAAFFCDATSVSVNAVSQ